MPSRRKRRKSPAGDLLFIFFTRSPVFLYPDISTHIIFAFLNTVARYAKGIKTKLKAMKKAVITRAVGKNMTFVKISLILLSYFLSLTHMYTGIMKIASTFKGGIPTINPP